MINLGDGLTIFHLWTVAAVVFGFQLAALAWRLNREIFMATKGERIWIPVADIMIYFSVLVLIGGVFIAPLFGMALDWAVWWFGLVLVIFAGVPPVIAGHYNLYRYNPCQRPRITTQEWWAFISVLLVIGLYLAWGLVLLCSKI